MNNLYDHFTFSNEMPPEGVPTAVVAAEVGRWLEQGQPDTKPVPTVVLEADLILGDGIAIFTRQRQPVGYIAVRPSAALPVSFGAGRPEFFPHFKIESWVVGEGMRGNGLGGMLLNAAELSIRSQIYPSAAHRTSGTSYALASAVAVHSHYGYSITTDFSLSPSRLLQRPTGIPRANLRIPRNK